MLTMMNIQRLIFLTSYRTTMKYVNLISYSQKNIFINFFSFSVIINPLNISSTPKFNSTSLTVEFEITYSELSIIFHFILKAENVICPSKVYFYHYNYFIYLLFFLFFDNKKKEVFLQSTIYDTFQTFTIGNLHPYCDYTVSTKQRYTLSRYWSSLYFICNFRTLATCNYKNLFKVYYEKKIIIFFSIRSINITCLLWLQFEMSNL